MDSCTVHCTCIVEQISEFFSSRAIREIVGTYLNIKEHVTASVNKSVDNQYLVVENESIVITKCDVKLFWEGRNHNITTRLDIISAADLLSTAIQRRELYVWWKESWHLLYLLSPLNWFSISTTTPNGPYVEDKFNWLGIAISLAIVIFAIILASIFCLVRCK